MLQLLLIWPRPSHLLTDFHFIVSLFYQALISQVLLHYFLDKAKITTDEDKTFVANLKGFVTGLSKNVQVKSLVIPPSHLENIKDLCMPFVRCASLFLNTCLDRKAPEIDLEDDDYVYEEFSFLLQFLQLPSIQSVLDSCSSTGSVTKSLASSWLDQFLRKNATLPDLAPAHPFKLIQLPELYHDLLSQYSKLRCVKCKTIPVTKALCLMCGKLLCAGNACCRDLGIGECSLHTRSCGGGVGLFLILKMSSVLVIRGPRHSFWGSPYLDEYGEEDIHLIRGRPLYFNKERYEQLTQLVLSQRLEYDSKIVDATILEETEWY